MKRRLLVVLPVAVLTLGLFARAETPPEQSSKPSHDGSAKMAHEEKKFEDFDKVVKGAKEEAEGGLFKLYHKDEHLYAEIKPDQLDKPFLCPIAIARGAGLGGYTLNFEDQWVLLFKRIGDKVHLIRRNVHFRAKPGSPAAHAVETTYTDSVLMALPIKSINPKNQAVLLDFNDIFMTDFAELGLGSFDANRSTWHKIKTFPHNVELEVAATFSSPNYGFFFGDDSVIDNRGKTVVIHYGLCQLPDDHYQPRLADDRVGYFLSVVKDFSSDKEDTSFLRFVNRWRLERAEPIDPKHPNKLSPPKQHIRFWIEKSVPEEYRAAVREGILEWNKAFEKIGFRDAIEVRQQEDGPGREDDNFDPEDIRYNTFRWITTDQGFAMGPSRANPLTGEILDADIIFDASMVRFWREEAKLFQRAGAPASLIKATRLGWGLFDPLDSQRNRKAALEGWNDPKKAELNRLRGRLMAARQGACQCGAHMRYELSLASMALAAEGKVEPGEKVPEELIQQAVKHVTMHEVGHTLGLRHNFKASTMLKNEQLNDTSITRKQGLVGSVMDYSPINLAPKGVKQGDYFSTTLGPYDYWAIAYAYKPLKGDTEGELEELRKIAKDSPKYVYATDEDMYSTSDPLVNVWDLGADPMKFAQDRIVLAESLLKGVEDRVVDKGEGYQRARMAFNILLGQFGNGAYLTSRYIGGEYMNRDHRDDPRARDPFVPVKSEKQREALKFLQEHILSDKHFQFSPRLLRHLAADRWMHWGNEWNAFGSVDYPLHERILAIQKIVLDQVFDPSVLSRIQNNALKADKDEKPLTIAEVFRSVTDGIWNEGAVAEKNGKEGKQRVASSVIRRNLQREHLKNLFTLVLGKRQQDYFFSVYVILFGDLSSVPPDARSLARMHLRDIRKRIDDMLKDKQLEVDDTTRAHLEECRERIAKVLNASMQVQEP